METLTRLVSSLGGLYLLAILLRFLLQVARADFYNPISQSVVRITDPMVRVFRTFIPGYRGIDFSTLVLALVVEAALVVILNYLYGYQLPAAGEIITWSLAGLIFFIINIYYWSIIATIIMSFVMLFSGNVNPHPALQLLWQLTEPIMRPIRNIIPPMGGLDFSPIFIFIGIEFLKEFLFQVFQVDGRMVAVTVGL
ncbi:MAG: YggT family protein [Gammaproteobacteria bacterium]|nr:YggT family protein [Pseudomonadales bacterium]MCP5347535.1 YggT family protein [Pseudomonadales bacterium]